MFSARRKPKRIAREEPQSHDNDEEDTGPVVRRPGAVKTKSKLRLSFQPGGEDQSQQDEVESKTSRAGTATNTLSSLPLFNTDRQDDLRPTYSKSALDALRNSTPSTPRDIQVYNLPTGDSAALDVAAKFGASSINNSSIIPSAAEIKEKKERRARLAKEQGADGYIALEDYDSDGEFKPQRMQAGSYFARETKLDTRLVQDDEDFAEGFEEFVEDEGKITTGRRGMAEQVRKEREAMRDLIDQAEGSEEDQSDSEVEQSHAYESAQTHHGMDGLAAHSKHRRETDRPKQPREVTMIPKLAAALQRLREEVQKIEMEKAKIERRRADVRKERAVIQASQEHVQKSLEEAGEELERLHGKAQSDSELATGNTMVDIPT